MRETHGWWSNVSSEYDSEMERIDGLLPDGGELSDQIVRVRNLIAALDLRTQRGMHRIECIIEVIGSIDPATGTVGSTTSAACDGRTRRQALAQICELWVKQTPVSDARVLLPAYAEDVDEIYARLGDFSPLKAWQVERLQLKIADYGFADVVQSYAEGGGAREDADGPCRWELETRLLDAFTAIGGGAATEAGGRCHLCYGRVREQTLEIIKALEDFAWQRPAGGGWVHAALGVYCPLKAWLAASLARTIISQLG